MKSLIATSTYFFDEIQLKKQNLNSIIWVPEFGCQNRYTSLPNSLDMSLLWWMKHVLKLCKIPSYYAKDGFESDATSEHNTILSQVRTTYQKCCQQRNLKACLSWFWPKFSMLDDGTLLRFELCYYLVALFLL